MNASQDIYPGQILPEEFLKPFGIRAYELPKDLRIPQTRVSLILKGKRRVSADTALRLSEYFGTSTQFWSGLQNDFDIEEEKIRLGKDLMFIPRIIARM